MADISLKEYQTKLDNLLTANQFSEVIAHSRHILQAYPKNLTAYRQLALALFGLSRFDESGELFRRLLGSVPNDFVSHFRLSQIYENAKQYEDAIWHLERAFDQQPNNQDIIKKLRDLYRMHRNVDLQRIQLTAGAVAQQHVRNNLYDQAIEVLHKALDRYPARVDLRLLLARSLWYAERYLDAAETAIDVLAVLPYSMIANRILTELWLMEQRPSDAQRYLTRIEDLDPYLAYRLATGENPPDDLIVLEELDYATVSRHELATANPDWLTAIDETGEELAVGDEDEDWLNDLVDDDIGLENSAPRKKVTDDLEDLLPDEWQQRVDSLETAPSDEDLESLFGDDFDLESEFEADLDFSDFEDELDDEPDLDLSDETAEKELPEELLRRIEKMKGLAADETIASINKPVDEDFGSGLTGLLSTLDDKDDMSWLKDVQHGEFDTVVGQVLGDVNEISEDADADPDSWMAEFEDIETSPEDERVSTGFTDMFDDMEEGEEDFDDFLDEIDAPDTNMMPANDDSDPLAWMEDSGIELSEDDLSDEPYDPYDTEDVGFQSAEVDPMDWLKKSHTDSLNAEALFPAQSDDPNDVDPLAWMDDNEVELSEDEEADAAFASSNMPQFFDDMDEPEAPADDEDWLTDESLLDEMLSMEEDYSTLDFEDDSSEDVSELAPVSTQADDWQDDMNDELNNDWQDDQPEDENDFSWLSDDDSSLPQFFDDENVDAQAEKLSASDDPVDLEDMFAELSDDDFADADEGLEWLETQDMIEDSMSQSDDDFDDDEDIDPLAWMADSGIELTEEPASESTGMTDMLNALESDDTSDDEEMDLDFEEEEFDDEAPTISQRTGLLDRMSNLPTEDQFPDWLDDPENPIAEDEEEWLSEDDAEDESEVDEAQWLSGIDAEGEEFDFEEEEDEDAFSFEAPNAIEDEPDWLSEMDSEEEEVQPDWLSGVDHDEDFATMEEESEDEGAGWLSDMGDFEDDEEEAVADEQPDWLAGVAVAGAGAAALGAAGAMFDDEDEEAEFSDFEDEFEEEDDGFATQANQADWLASVDLDEEAEFSDFEDEFEEEDDGFATQANQADWLASVDVEEDDEEDALVDEQPDWLSASGDFEEDDEFAIMDEGDSEDEGAGWLPEMGAFEDDEEEAVADEQPDWLSASSDFEDDEDDMMEEADAGADWLADMAEFEDEDEEDAFVSEQPDWLAASDEFEDEEEAIPSPTDWLSEEDIDEFGEEAIASDSPDLDWMQSDEFVDDEILEDDEEEIVEYLDAVDPVTAESALDWMSEVEDEIIFDEDAEVPEPASITDWLTTDEEEQATTVGEVVDEEADFGDFDDFDEYEDEGTVVGEAVDEGADWLSDMGDFEDDEEEAVPGEMPDWLTGAAVVGSGAAASAMFGDDDDEEDAIQEGEGFDWDEELAGTSQSETSEPEWFNAINDSESDEEAYSDEEFDLDEEVDEGMWLEDEESFSAETQASSGIYDNMDYLDDFEEVTEHTPATDAPDWLNAMVPGLDIDFEAEEDEPVDQGFIEEPVQAAQKKDKGFDWLTDIVAEETGPMQAIATDKPQPIMAPRFIFSRPPVWLNKLLGTSAPPPVVADLNEDEDFDFEDFDESSDNGSNFVDSTMDDDDFDDDFAESKLDDDGDFDDDFPEWLDFDDDDDNKN